MAEHTEYLVDHPEVKQLITDYIQTLLVVLLVSTVKPDNVIDFTIQHFKAFAKDPIPWETSTRGENDDDVISQLAEKTSEVVCGICGLTIKCSKEISSRSSYEECLNICSYDSMKSIKSYDTSTSTSCKIKTSSEEQSVDPQDDSNLETACSKCHTIMKTCDKYQPLSKCPGCFKITNTCSKCSIIDQIIHMLKG
nr:uncharacterized protein LOC117226241 [Megalopta genalis]